MKDLIRFDWALKRLLRNKANYTVLEGFLSVLLKDGVPPDTVRRYTGLSEEQVAEIMRNI